MEALRCDAVLPRARVYPSLATQTQRSIIGVGLGRLKNFFRERARRHISRTYGFRTRLFRIWLLARVPPRTCGSPAFSPARAAPFACVPPRVCGSPAFSSARAAPPRVCAPCADSSRARLPCAAPRAPPCAAPVHSLLACAPPACVPPRAALWCAALSRARPRTRAPRARLPSRAAPSRNQSLLRREVVVHIPLICPEQFLSWQI